jgi:hypothetical protein
MRRLNIPCCVETATPTLEEANISYEMDSEQDDETKNRDA